MVGVREEHQEGQQATPPRVEVAENGYSWAGSGQVPFLPAKRARSECAPSMRAVKESLPAPPKAKGGKPEGPRLG